MRFSSVPAKAPKRFLVVALTEGGDEVRRAVVCEDQLDDAKREMSRLADWVDVIPLDGAR